MVAVGTRSPVRTQTTGRRARVASAGALVALMVLAGCGPAESEDEPTVGFPATTTAPVTAEPTAVAAPELPAAGETVVFPEGAELPAPSPTAPPADEDFPLRGENSEAGAIDAAKYYWQLNILGRATGENAGLRSMSDVECGFCANLIEVHDRVKSGDLYVSADYATTEDVKLKRKADGGYIVNFQSSQPVYYAVDPTGRRVQAFADVGTVGLELVWRDGSWCVVAGAVQGNGGARNEEG
jgi:hypothetical protein